MTLRVAKARAHILEGLKIALANIDKVIATIRKAQTVEIARQQLMSGFGLSQTQAQAILDMQLRRLANLERQKLLDEYAEVVKTIAYLEDLLANPRRILLLIKEEVSELKSQYADPRRTQISEEEVVEFREEDLIPHQSVVVTLSTRGFVKRVAAKSFRPQHRGGKGIIGMVTREADAVRLLEVADTHDNLLFFTNRGRVFHLKCYEIPADTSRVAKGMAVVNLFSIAGDERVTAVIALADFTPGAYLLMATRYGEIKRTAVESFASVRSSGLIAMDLEPEDELVAACLATDRDDILLVTEGGQAIRFAASVSLIFHPVKAGHIDAGDIGYLTQEFFFGGSIYLPLPQKVNQLRQNLLPLADNEEVNKVSHRLGVQCRAAAGDDYGVGASLCRQDGYLPQVEDVQDIGVGKLVV